MTTTQTLFSTIQRYVSAVNGEQVNFFPQRNALSPLGFLISALNFFSASHRENSAQSAFRLAFYPPIFMLFKLNDPRACDLVKTHYQGIGSLKGRLQVAYFTALKSNFFQKILLPGYVDVFCQDIAASDLEKILGSMVFGGLGSKVKIFHFDDHKIVSILKEGYDDRFLLKEIEVREKFQTVLPVPRLISANREKKFFEEEYCQAVPVRNLTPNILPALADLFEKLFVYHKQEEVLTRSTNEYVAELAEMIGQNCIRLPDESRERVKEITAFFEKQQRVFAHTEIRIVWCHGDFWLGNILFEKQTDRLLLVDWERTGRYSLLHDLFTLLSVYSIEQSDTGYLERLLTLKSDEGWLNTLIEKYKNTFDISLGRVALEIYLMIFLSERICFVLKHLTGAKNLQQQAIQELNKWYNFFTLLRAKGIFKDLL